MTGSFIPNDHVGTAGDFYTKEIFKGILRDGCLDINPRPIYLYGKMVVRHILFLIIMVCVVMI